MTKQTHYSKPWARVPDDSGQEHAAEHTDHFMTRKQRGRGQGPTIPLKGIPPNDCPLDPPLSFHHLQRVTPWEPSLEHTGLWDIHHPNYSKGPHCHQFTFLLWQ